MSERQMVCWEDISEDALHSLFHVWTDGRQLQWAKKSWEALAKRGLTSYSDQIERTRVLVRLITLGTFYREFCDLAWDEYFCPTEEYDPTYAEWAHDLGISPFRISQCLGPDYNRDGHTDDCDLLTYGIAELADQERASTHEALADEFGGDSMLFVSLWNTVDYRTPADDAEDFESEDVEEDDTQNLLDTTGDDAQECVPDEIPNEKAEDINWAEDAGIILNNTTPEKLRSFEWLAEGMPRVR